MLAGLIIIFVMAIVFWVYLSVKKAIELSKNPPDKTKDLPPIKKKDLDAKFDEKEWEDFLKKENNP